MPIITKNDRLEETDYLDRPDRLPGKRVVIGPPPKPSANGHHEHNGFVPVPESPSPEKHTSLASRVADCFRPEQVDIGCPEYVPEEDDDTATWADLDQRNAKVRFLLKRWIAYAMLTGIVGEPKAGKSAFVMWALVRPIITGCGWFTGQRGCKPGYVVWCDTEHRAALNLERAAKWGLPFDRIKTPFKDTHQIVNMDNPEHVGRIVDVVCRYKAKLVVVDSYRGAHHGDENNSKISTGLQALGGVCEKTGTACSIIHHAKKMSIGEDMTINCGRGSNAFLAAVACQIAIDIPDPRPNLRDAWRRVQVLGENLGIAPTPMGFRISDAGLKFGPAPTRPPKEEKETGKDKAEAWLRARMEPGEWYEAEQLEIEAEALDFSKTGTLQRARESLGIVQPDNVKKRGKGWHWRLPNGGEQITGRPGNS